MFCQNFANEKLIFNFWRMFGSFFQFHLDHLNCSFHFNSFINLYFVPQTNTFFLIFRNEGINTLPCLYNPLSRSSIISRRTRNFPRTVENRCSRRSNFGRGVSKNKRFNFSANPPRPLKPFRNRNPVVTKLTNSPLPPSRSITILSFHRSPS